jgi:IS5 family transposase
LVRELDHSHSVRLQKNTAHLLTLFALSNLWMARRHLMGQVRPKAA